MKDWKTLQKSLKNSSPNLRRKMLVRNKVFAKFVEGSCFWLFVRNFFYLSAKIGFLRGKCLTLHRNGACTSGYAAAEKLNIMNNERN